MDVHCSDDGNDGGDGHQSSCVVVHITIEYRI